MHVSAFAECRFWLVLAGCMPTAPISFESFLDTIISILPPLFASGFIFSDRDIIFHCRPQGPHHALLVRVFQIRPLLQCREICTVPCGFRACCLFFDVTPMQPLVHPYFGLCQSVRSTRFFFHLSICVSGQERHHPYLVPSLSSKAPVLLNKSTSIAIAKNYAGLHHLELCGHPPVA